VCVCVCVCVCRLMCGGTLRSDRVYPAGPITVRQINAIFPFPDPCVVIKATGQQLLDALENGVVGMEQGFRLWGGGNACTQCGAMPTRCLCHCLLVQASPSGQPTMGDSPRSAAFGLSLTPTRRRDHGFCGHVVWPGKQGQEASGLRGCGTAVQVVVGEERAPLDLEREYTVATR
jgi:hypothetical protein